MIIAIDGPAGSGKSTIASLLAEHYNAVFMNTGSFYRALTYKLLKTTKDKGGQSPFTELDSAFIVSVAKNLEIKYEMKDGDSCISLDGKDITNLLRSDEVEANVSQVSAIPEVRDAINEKIKKQQ